MVPKQEEAGQATAKESTGAITAGAPRVTGRGGSHIGGGGLMGSIYMKQCNIIENIFSVK